MKKAAASIRGMDAAASFFLRDRARAYPASLLNSSLTATPPPTTSTVK